MTPKEDEILTNYIKDVAPLFCALFPLMNAAAICAKKIELRAFRDKLKTKQQRKHDLALIEQTAARLYALADKYKDDHLHTPNTTEDDRDHATLVLLESSNTLIYFLLRIQNALVAGATTEDLIKLDSVLKLMAKDAHGYDVMPPAIFEEFNLWQK